MNRLCILLGLAPKPRQLGGGRISSWTLCGVRIGNYVNLNCKTRFFLWKMNPKDLVKKIEIWHLLHGITPWTTWIMCNNKVFNQEQWHVSKVKHLIWDNLVMDAKIVWVGWLNLSRFVLTWPNPSLMVRQKLGGQGKSFIGGIRWESLEIGIANICRLFWHFGRFLGGVGVVLGGVLVT